MELLLRLPSTVPCFPASRPPIVAHAHSHASPPPPSQPPPHNLEPFNRSRLSRLAPEPPLLRKAENAIADRCSILEGDEAYHCWEALFEFENMKHEFTDKCNLASSKDKSTDCQPLERLENLVRQSGGVSSLIDNVLMLSKTRNLAHANEETVQTAESTDMPTHSELHFFPEPDSLPPTKEDLELQESARMPESSFTKVLRKIGGHTSPISDFDSL